MIKKINFSLVLLLVYVLISLYFAIFNWEIFILQLNISLGFTSVKMSFISVIVFIGFIIILILSILKYVSDLKQKQEQEILKKDIEISSVKISFYEEKEKNFQDISQSLMNLQSKIVETFNLKPSKENHKKKSEETKISPEEPVPPEDKENDE